MGGLIAADKQEALILAYIRIKYLTACGKLNKIYIHLEHEARELGFSIRTAWRILARARRIGMIESFCL